MHTNLRKEIEMSWSLSHLLSIVAGSVVAQKGIDILTETGTQVVTKKIEKSLKENRSETLALIISEVREADEKASNKLLARHRKRQKLENRAYKPYKPYDKGDESKMVHGLSELYGHLQTEGEKELRIEVFRYLGNLSEKKFDDTLEWLVDDRVQQWLGKIFRTLRGAYEHSEKAVRDLMHRVLDALVNTKGRHAHDTIRNKLKILFFEAVALADKVGALAADLTGVGLDAINEGMDTLKERSWIWNRLIA